MNTVELITTSASEHPTPKGHEPMGRLTENAREYLSNAVGIDGIAETDWARFWGAGDPEWKGDVCGCPDDRCIGHHHSSDEPCDCLMVLGREYDEAEREAIELSKRHQAGDPTAVVDGEMWVAERSGSRTAEWSYDVLVDGQAGIAVRLDGEPSWRLLWAVESSAPQAT